MKMSDLEESPYLSDDSIVTECDLTVIKDPIVVDCTNPLEIPFPVPPSDLSRDLAKLLEAGDETDVVLRLKGRFSMPTRSSSQCDRRSSRRSFTGRWPARGRRT